MLPAFAVVENQRNDALEDNDFLGIKHKTAVEDDGERPGARVLKVMFGKVPDAFACTREGYRTPQMR